MSRKLLAIFFALMCCTAGCGAQHLNSSDLSDWAVVLGNNPIESEKTAAKDFCEIYNSAFKSSLKVTDTIPNNKKYILIGQCDGISTANLGKEGLKIIISPDRIVITGGRPRGTLYGVYEFFEKYLDIQFLTYHYTYIPDYVKNTQLPIGTYQYIPPLSFRWAHMRENLASQHYLAQLKNNVRAWKPAFGGDCGWSLINHSFDKQLDVKKYGKEHPEYFQVLKGKRAVSWTNKRGEGPNPCYASKGALDIITQKCLEYFKEHSDRKNVSASCNDSHNYCQCPKCLAVNKREGSPTGSHLEFVNKIADEVKKQYPEKFVGTLAYFHTRKPPKHIRARDNVQIQLCNIEACCLHDLDDPNCPKNAAFYKDLKGWSEKCDNIMAWTYQTNFKAYDLPCPNLKSIGNHVKVLCDNNVKGIYMQAAGNSSGSDFSDLKSWVMHQCLWKPGLDSWELSKKFCRMYYGKAAGPIIAWLEYFHDYEFKANIHPKCSTDAKTMKMTFALAVKGKEYFDEAMHLADNEEIKNRVEKASISIYRMMIETTEYKEIDGVKFLEFPQGYEDTLETYKKLIVKHNVTKPREAGSYEEFFKRIKTAR